MVVPRRSSKLLYFLPAMIVAVKPLMTPPVTMKSRPRSLDSMNGSGPPAPKWMEPAASAWTTIGMPRNTSTCTSRPCCSK
jgi:hypothetical protein